VLPEQTDPLVGSMLGKDYLVLERIGVGGMAVVYLVEHQTLLKRFAAKVLSLELASSLEARARFTQEAHSASQLDHDNIVSISDFGVTLDHRPFFVMELLRGKTLDQRLTEGRMSLEEVVAVSVPVARALAYAHAEGIVHLDVKPENIFLVQRSRGRWGVKVVDFGIAKTPLNPRVTKLGETNGSPLFMAPETVRGDDDVDQRADVYSFGILLYLMMCGRLPFVDDSLHRVLQMQLVQLPPPPRQVNSELSPELAAVVERALAKRRDDRYASMEALLIDLAAALPDGADRLLIEAQTGTAASETPFADAMSITTRPDSRPDSRPATRSETRSEGSAHTRPDTEPDARPSRPAMFQSVLPQAPNRKRPVVITAAVVATVVAGALAWRLTHGPITSTTRRGETLATSSVIPALKPSALQAEPSKGQAAGAADTAVGAGTDTAADADPAAETGTGAAAGAHTGAAAEAAAATDPDTAAGAPTEPTIEARPAAPPAIAVDEPPTGTTLARAKLDRPVAVGKKPVVRPKGVVRPAPPRPAKRSVMLAAASPGITGGVTGAAPSTVVEAPAARPAEPEAAPEPAPPPPAATEPSPPREATDGSAAPRPAAPTPPPPKAAPPAPKPAALDASPELVSVEVKGSLSRAVVRRSVERTLASLRTCYRTAARSGGVPGGAAVIEVQLSFEIDENSLATHVATRGASFGSLASCAIGVASQIRTQEAPDVGTAQVTAVIRFRPL
jgi:eukaryotic-like serine/threonine-protein kinase